MIPNFLYLESEIELGDTWCYISDEDNFIYTFTNCKDGLQLGRYCDCIAVNTLLDEIVYNAKDF